MDTVIESDMTAITIWDSCWKNIIFILNVNKGGMTSLCRCLVWGHILATDGGEKYQYRMFSSR